MQGCGGITEETYGRRGVGRSIPSLLDAEISCWFRSCLTSDFVRIAQACEASSPRKRRTLVVPWRLNSGVASALVPVLESERLLEMSGNATNQAVLRFP